MNNSIRLMVVGLAILVGCGKQDESIAKQAGSKVGETLTDFASGVGKGVDKQMAVTVELTESLAGQGISRTVAKSAVDLGRPDTKGFTVYLIAAKPFTSKLVAKALTKDGQEIGRSVEDVEFAADDSKYVTFQFDREVDTQLVDKYIVDIKK